MVEYSQHFIVNIINIIYHKTRENQEVRMKVTNTNEKIGLFWWKAVNKNVILSIQLKLF